MSQPRTSGFVMFLRFMVFSAIPIALLAAVFAAALPVIIPVVLVVMALVFIFNWGFTNWLVRTFAPDYYAALKAGGGDPFLDNLGAPLNTDPDDVRQRGTVPNTTCPHCGAGLYLEPHMQARCGGCNLLYDRGAWYGSVNGRWTPYLG